MYFLSVTMDYFGGNSDYRECGKERVRKELFIALVYLARLARPTHQPEHTL